MSINELQKKCTTFIFLFCLSLSQFLSFYLYLPPTTIGDSSIDSELTSVGVVPVPTFRSATNTFHTYKTYTLNLLKHFMQLGTELFS